MNIIIQFNYEPQQQQQQQPLGRESESSRKPINQILKYFNTILVGTYGGLT